MAVDLRHDLWGCAEDVDAVTGRPAANALRLRRWERVLEISGPGSGAVVQAHRGQTVERIRLPRDPSEPDIAAGEEAFDVVVVAPEAAAAGLSSLFSAAQRRLAGGGRLIGRVPGPGHLGSLRCSQGCARTFTPAQVAASLETHGFSPRMLVSDCARQPLSGGRDGLAQLLRHRLREAGSCRCAQDESESEIAAAQAPAWDGRHWTVLTAGVLFVATKGLAP